MPVSDITVTRVDNTAVRVTWTGLTLNEARGFPTYVVNITKEGEQVSFQRTNTTSAVVGGLMPHTEYSVTVQALTAGGTKEGPISAPGETEMHHMHTYSYSYRLEIVQTYTFETKQSLYIDLLSHSGLTNTSHADL